MSIYDEIKIDFYPAGDVAGKKEISLRKISDISSIREQLLDMESPFIKSSLLNCDLIIDYLYKEQIALVGDNDWKENCKEWDRSLYLREQYQIMTALRPFLDQDGYNVKDFCQNCVEISNNTKMCHYIGSMGLVSNKIIKELLMATDDELTCRLMFAAWALNASGKMVYTVDKNLFEAIFKSLLVCFDFNDENGEKDAENIKSTKPSMAEMKDKILLAANLINIKNGYYKTFLLAFSYIQLLKNANHYITLHIKGNKKDNEKLIAVICGVSSILKNISLNSLRTRDNSDTITNMDIAENSETINLILNCFFSIILVHDGKCRVEALRACLNFIEMIPFPYWMLDMHKRLLTIPFITSVVKVIPSLEDEYNTLESRAVGCCLLSCLSRSHAGRGVLNSSDVNNTLHKLLISLYELGIEDKGKGSGMSKLTSISLVERQDSAAHVLAGLWGCLDFSISKRIPIFDDKKGLIKLLIKMSQFKKSASSIIICATGALGTLSSISKEYAHDVCTVLDHSEFSFDSLLSSLVTSKNLLIQHLGFWNLRNLCTVYDPFRFAAVNKGYLGMALSLIASNSNIGKEVLENTIASALLLSEPTSIINKQGIRTLYNALGWGNIKVARFVTCIICASSINDNNLMSLSDVNIVLQVLSWVIHLFYTLYDTTANVRVPAPTSLSFSQSTMEHNEKDYHFLFESALASLWALFYDDVAARAAKHANAIDILCTIVKSDYTTMTGNTKTMAFKALWLLANMTNATDELVENDMIMESLKVALNKEANAVLRCTACQFLSFLVENPIHFKKLQTISKVKVPLECIYISFLDTSDEILANYAGIGLARQAVSANGELSKKACEELGGIPLLLKWADSSRCENILEAITMALCNISIRPENQVVLTNAGLYQLINLARDTINKMPVVWKYLSGTMSNLTKNPINRTKFYKAELSAKIVDSGKNEMTSSEDLDKSNIKGTEITRKDLSYLMKQKESALKNKDKNKYLLWFEKNMLENNNNKSLTPLSVDDKDIDYNKRPVSSPIALRKGKNDKPTRPHTAIANTTSAVDFKVTASNNNLKKSLTLSLNSIWSDANAGYQCDSPTGFGYEELNRFNSNTTYTSHSSNSNTKQLELAPLKESKRWNPLIRDVKVEKVSSKSFSMITEIEGASDNNGDVTSTLLRSNKLRTSLSVSPDTFRHKKVTGGEKRDFASQNEKTMKINDNTFDFAIFDHLEGAHYCEDIYDHFTLPGGRCVHFYQQDSLHETVAPEIEYFPSQPTCLKEFLLTNIPTIELPYWPKVHGKPLPLPSMPPPISLPSSFASNSQHLVKPIHHACTTPICYLNGYPLDYNMQVFFKKTNGEEIAKEKKNSDANALVIDVIKDPTDWNLLFFNDWTRAKTNTHFVQFLKENGISTMEEEDDLLDILKKYIFAYVKIFYYYSSDNISLSVLDMRENSLRAFLSDIKLLSVKVNLTNDNEEDDHNLTPRTLGIMFAEVNNETGRIATPDTRGSTPDTKKSRIATPDHDDKEHQDVIHNMAASVSISSKAIADLNKLNNDKALMRFEFLEMLVRIAANCFKKSKVVNTLPEAIDHLFQHNIFKYVDKVQLAKDTFRAERMGCPSNKVVLKQNVKKLRKIYSILNKQDQNAFDDGELNFGEFFVLIDAIKLFDIGGLSKREIMHCLISSQTLGVDEIRDRKKLQLLTFSDFLEALCRVADIICLPSDEDIKAASDKVGSTKTIQYLKWVDREDNLLSRRPSTANALAVSKRDFGEKFSKFLEIFYYAIYPEGEGILPDDKITMVMKDVLNFNLPKSIMGMKYYNEIGTIKRPDSGKTSSSRSRPGSSAGKK